MSMSTVSLYVSTAFFVGISACSSVPQVYTPIHDSEQGTVTLSTFTDPQFKATHPRTVESSILAQLLTSLRVQEQKAVLADLVTGSDSPLSAFAEDEVTFLAPLLASGLSRATAEEQVSFSVFHQAPKGMQRTVGLLFVSGPVLHFTLTEYRVPSSGPSLLSRPSSSFNRPKQWLLEFHSRMALLNGTKAIQVSTEDSNLKTLQIDYNRLAKLSDSRGKKTSDSFGSSAARSGRPTADPQKQQELDVLKEEVKDLKEFLREQNRKLKSLETQIHQKDQQ